MAGRRDVLTGIGAAAVTATAGCTAVGGTDTSPELRLAYDAAPPHFQAVVMQRESMLDDVPARVNPKEASCNSIVQLLVSGKADLGMIGVIPALVAIDTGPPIHAISASSRDAFVVMAREEVADRFERRGGQSLSAFAAENDRPFELGTYPKGSVSDITARYWLSEVVDATADVSLVHLGGPGAARQALLTGEVDGAVIPEPTPTLIEATDAPYRRIAWVGEFLAGEPAGVTVARDEYVEHHPDVVESFIAQHAAASSFVAERPDEAARYMSDVYGGESALDTATARTALESPATEYVTDPHAIVSGTEILQQYAHRLGKIAQPYGTDRIFEMAPYERAVA